MLHSPPVRRYYLLLLFMVFSGILSHSAFAEPENIGPVIFDVRRSLPLEPTEPVFHDFYIGAGAEAGFRKGQYATVVRELPIHDPIQNKQQAIMSVNIARLQIIHVQHGITVGRLYSEFTNEERPTVEFEAVMIGDRIDIASLTSTAPGRKNTVAPSTPAAP